MVSQSPILAQLLTTINNDITSRSAKNLQSTLLIEPPFPPIYTQLISHLQSSYPASSPTSTSTIEDTIRNAIPTTRESEDEQGRPVPSWGAMVTFLSSWLAFIRDVDVENLLETYQRLSDLQQKITAALQHPTNGVLVLPTLISYAKVFSRIAIGLDKRPELIAHLLDTSEDGRSESLPEKAANSLRSAFIVCLNDRNTAPGGVKNGRPDGKKIGIYLMANICLKILFAAQRLDNCKMIFDNIQNSSPPLHIYPASQRVTYLYFLGRYKFANEDFYAAQLCLQKAYEESPAHGACVKQRRLILIYLMTTNLLLGRFPNPELYTRPEAAGLRERFEPLTTAIRRGDLAGFKRITNLDCSHPHASWFCRYRLFYQIGSHCEVYVWRSLFRKVFILVGKQGDANTRAAPTLDLQHVLSAFLYFDKRLHMTEAMAQADGGPGNRHITMALFDFAGPDTGKTPYIDPDFAGVEGILPYKHVYDIDEMEAICASLIAQEFLNGFIDHKSKRFAITGAKTIGGLKAGFPNIWKTLCKRYSEQGPGGIEHVQGWKRDVGRLMGMGGVVRLSGARPAGS